MKGEKYRKFGADELKRIVSRNRILISAHSGEVKLDEQFRFSLNYSFNFSCNFSGKKDLFAVSKQLNNLCD